MFRKQQQLQDESPNLPILHQKATLKANPFETLGSPYFHQRPSTQQILENIHIEFTCIAWPPGCPSQQVSVLLLTLLSSSIIGGHPLDTPHLLQELPPGLSKNISKDSLNSS